MGHHLQHKPTKGQGTFLQVPPEPRLLVLVSSRAAWLGVLWLADSLRTGQKDCAFIQSLHGMEMGQDFILASSQQLIQAGLKVTPGDIKGLEECDRSLV